MCVFVFVKRCLSLYVCEKVFESVCVKRCATIKCVKFSFWYERMIICHSLCLQTFFMLHVKIFNTHSMFFTL